MKSWYRLLFLGTTAVAVVAASCNHDNPGTSDLGSADFAVGSDMAGSGSDDGGGDGGAVSTDMAMPLALTAASPPTGPTTGNIDVTISGTGFLSGAFVTIDGQSATVKSVTSTAIVVTLPARPGTKGPVAVVVTNPGGKTVMSSTIFAYYFGTLSFDTAVKTTFGGTPTNIAITEIENNAKPDIVVTDNSSIGQIVTLSGNGNGTFLTPAKFAAGISTYGLKVLDMDADGFNDVVVTNASSAPSGVGIHLNSKTGTFPSRTPVVTGDIPFSVDAKDINGDGYIDLIVANGGGSSNNLAFLLGKVGGTYAAPVNLTAGTVPRSVVFVDVNKDGKTDIVAANESTANVSVFIGDGTGNFGNKKDYQAGSGPYSVAATDFNGDGNVDLIVCNSRDATIALLTGVGDGSFNAPKTTSLGTPNTSLPYQIAIGDINGDGRPDVVSAIYADQQIGITYNANGLFGTTTKLAASGFPRGVAVGDLNGDGTTDIVSANSTDGSISIILNKSK